LGGLLVGIGDLGGVDGGKELFEPTVHVLQVLLGHTFGIHTGLAYPLVELEFGEVVAVFLLGGQVLTILFDVGLHEGFCSGGCTVETHFTQTLAEVQFFATVE